jgi:hypothetical protein
MLLCHEPRFLSLLIADSASHEWPLAVISISPPLHYRPHYLQRAGVTLSITDDINSYLLPPHYIYVGASDSAAPSVTHLQRKQKPPGQCISARNARDGPPCSPHVTLPHDSSFRDLFIDAIIRGFQRCHHHCCSEIDSHDT